MASTKPPPDLGPGWVDRFAPQHGDTNADQLMRARGGRPFKAKRATEQAVTALRGSRRAGRGKHIDAVLAALEPREAEDE
jgi:hypothetical protein